MKNMNHIKIYKTAIGLMFLIYLIALIFSLAS